MSEEEPTPKELLESISVVTESPSSLSKVKFKKHPSVILAAIRKRPNILGNLSSAGGLTPAIVHEVLHENGSWLIYVPKLFKTREACLIAVRQTDKALTFVPDDIKRNPDDPIFYEIFVDHEPSNIEYVPKDMLTDELILRAFHRNPNIIDISTLGRKIMKVLKDYDAPVPPSLRRRISDVHTDQGGDGVCGRHAFSRVILKNFVETFLSLHPTEQYMEQSCNVFLETTRFVNKEKYPDASLKLLTPQVCSYTGYLKILLFLHLFWLFQEHIPSRTDRVRGWIECIQVSELYHHLYKRSKIPTLSATQGKDLTDALHTLKRVKDKYDISLATFHFKGRDLTLANIHKITHHGLYIMLRIEDSKHKDATHAAHFVLIVGSFDNYMLVKNSWNEDAIYKIQFDHPFYLESATYDRKTDCSFMIPVQHGWDVVFEDLTHVDDYLERYAQLKRKFQNIVVNVKDHQCPSLDREPVECVNVPHYREQEQIFHPRYNSDCRRDATLKFDRLKTLRGCREPVLLLGNRSRRRNKNKNKKQKQKQTKNKKQK